MNPYLWTSVCRLLCVALPMLAISGCISSHHGIAGSGHLITREFALGDFSRVDAGSAFQVQVTPAPQHTVAVTVDDNLLDHLEVSRSGDTLHLGLRGNVRNATVRAEVTLPALAGVNLGGAAYATVTGFHSTKPLAMGLSGATRLRGVIDSGQTRLNVSGASHVELDGRATRLRIEASGASHVNCEHFASRDTIVRASGASHVVVSARGELDAEASGASSVRYAAEPERVRSRASGGSSIRHR